MRVTLRSYGSGQELYVDGVLVLTARDMEVREALEAISDFTGEIDFSALELSPGGASKLFDDRFFVKSTGGLANMGKRTA